MAVDSQPIFQVDPFSDPVVVRICGRASFQNSAPLSTFFQEMAVEGPPRFIIDFEIPLNLEIAANPDMIDIANRYKPHSVCFVPENRKEITTEGGLDVRKNFNKLEKLVKDELDNDIDVSLFIDPDKDQIIATKDLGVKVVEFHTGAYAEAFCIQLSLETELNKIKDAVQLANDFNINCHAGHGLNFENVSLISSISNIKELNIGHFLISDAIFNGLENSIIKMKKIIKESTI